MEFAEFVELQELVVFCEVMKKPAKIHIDPNVVKKHLSPMGKKKRSHSMRVGDTIKDMGHHPDAAAAAYFHDYGERVGDPHDLPLSDTGKQIVKMLTAEGDPLEHMQQILEDPNLDSQTRSVIILIKIADRIDNLYRRLSERGKIPKKYIKKSRKLLKYLFSSYDGPSKHLKYLHNKLDELGVLIRSKYNIPDTRPVMKSTPFRTPIPNQ